MGNAFFEAVSDFRQELKIEKIIRKNWDVFMRTYYNITDLDKAKAQKEFKLYQIQEIYIKNYGFDAVITIPYGKDISEFRKLLPAISATYKANVIAESTKSKSAIYIRVHIHDLPIDTINEIRFKWYKHFNNGNVFRNAYGDTFRISGTKKILNPNNNKEIVGYLLNISIPEGLSYDSLLKEEDSLSRIIGKTFIKWNDKLSYAEVEIITKLLDNTEEFKVIKCKPYELYCSMTYSYKNIFLDMKTHANVLYSGINGSGKTVCMEQGLINLSAQYDSNIVKYFVSFISSKADLRALKNLRNTEFYGTTLDECLKVIKYLLKESERRNKLFEKCDDLIVNIFEYNETHKNKLPFLYFVSDEIIDFMSDNSDSDIDKFKKDCFVDYLKKIARMGRNSGIYLCLSLQEARKESISPQLKSQINCMVCFNQINQATGTTLLSSEQNGTRLTKLNKFNRECLVKYQDGLILSKSLCCTNKMIQNLVKPISIKDKVHLNINTNGEIIKINDEIQAKTIENNENITENEQNLSKNTKKVTVFNPKTHKYETKYIDGDDKPNRNSGRFRR